MSAEAGEAALTAGGTTDPVVDARGVHVELGGSHILRGVDVTVRRGDVVSVLGANGSGKSTLVRALVGAVPLSAGDVRLLGAPLGRTVPWGRIGYVPQRVSAGAGLTATAREVVVSGLLHRGRLRPPRDARARAGRALEQVGLATHAERPVAHLSGGQQQRVLIARALARDPELLVLDEPVAGVDLPSQEVFARTLGTLTAQGMTILVVLHELGAFAPLVSRAVILRHGVVVHDGPPVLPHADHAARDHEHVHPHESAPPPRDTEAPELRLEP